MLPAIILAAGASSRMGRTKALLTLPGGDSFLSRLATTLRRAGLEQIVAVVGADGDAIRAALAPLPWLRLVTNPEPSRGQLSSLLVGLDAVTGSPAPEAVLVTIVDLPLVAADTVSRVVAAWRAGRAPIVRPVCGGRHGHPAIFGASLFGELRAADTRVGARAVLSVHAAEILDVPVDDAGTIDDIDTPEEYDRVWSRLTDVSRG